MSERMKAALPAEDPTEALALRVAALANKPRPSPLPRRLAFAGALLVLVGGFWMSPRRLPRSAALGVPWQKLLYEVKQEDRWFRIYDICRNPKGDILMLYTMGKLPGDALVPDEKGTPRVRDGSITQDWVFVLRDQKEHYHRSETPLPFLSTPVSISPKRVSPTGEKFEAIALSGLPKEAEKEPLVLIVAVERENLHGPALWAVARRPRSEKMDWGGTGVNVAIKGLYSGPNDLWIRMTSEVVPQAWATAGVNVPLAIQHLQRNK